MSISTTTRKAGPFNGNDATSVFPFGFKVFAQSDVQVVQALLADGNETVLVQGTHYTVTLNTDQENNPGGSVVLLSGPLATGFSVTIVSNVPELQPATFTDQGGFYPRLLNAALDRATILVQQLREKLGRSVGLPVSAPAGVSTTLPLPVASHLLAWSEDGTRLINVTGTPNSIVSASMAPVLAVADRDTARELLGAAPAASYALSGTNTDITELDGLTEVPAVVAAADAAVLASVRNYLLNPRAEICQAKNGLNHVVTYNSTSWTYVWDRWAMQCQGGTNSVNWATAPGTVSTSPASGSTILAQFVPSEETRALLGVGMVFTVELTELNGGAGGVQVQLVLLRPSTPDAYFNSYTTDTLQVASIPSGVSSTPMVLTASFGVYPGMESSGFGVGVRIVAPGQNASARVKFAGLYNGAIPSLRIERSMAAELQECQRFYSRGAFKMYASAQPVAAGAVTFPVPMFSTPTVTFASGYAGRGYQPTQMEWIDSYSMGFNRQTNSELSFDWFARAEIQ